MPEAKSETPQVVTRPTKGTPDGPGDDVEREAVTGRPNDEPGDNSTFAARAKERQRSEKRIAEAQNKAVQSSETKRTK